MSSADKNLSHYSLKNTVDVSTKHFAIIVSEWNTEITESLFSGALKTLKAHQVKDTNIVRVDVPGSYELTLAAQKMAQREEVDAVICIGCVIGKTSVQVSSKKVIFLLQI